MNIDSGVTPVEETDALEKANLPKIVFDDKRNAKITTHMGNVYEIKKISDAAFMNAVSAGGETKVNVAMIALVAASLINPVRTRLEVENEFFDGELFYLSEVIGNHYESSSNFLGKPKTQMQ